MLPKDLTKDIKTRLKSVKGQVENLLKMLDEDKDPEKILIQFKATRSSLDKAHFLLLDETYRKALAIKISKTVEACPGNCGNEDRIAFIRQQFPFLGLDELTDKMREISEIEKRLESYNKKISPSGRPKK